MEVLQQTGLPHAGPVCHDLPQGRVGSRSPLRSRGGGHVTSTCIRAKTTNKKKNTSQASLNKYRQRQDCESQEGLLNRLSGRVDHKLVHPSNRLSWGGQALRIMYIRYSKMVAY